MSTIAYHDLVFSPGILLFIEWIYHTKPIHCHYFIALTIYS